MIERKEKLKAIANVAFEQENAGRSYDTIYQHMLSWHVKGWLNDAWIDGCFDAIMSKQPVWIIYTPGRHYNYMSSYKTSGAV